MSHGHHDLPRRVLGDDCQECVQRSMTIEGLAALDDGNLRKLAELAAELQDGIVGKPGDISWADMKAVGNLRLAARLTYRSGITEHTAE